ncbi:universal stress protein [Methylobacterium sp. 391_Methyba4]|uniref:universal stress protein n=1 Tax=Methylobacterium sp. 391_Methyba4 TaxID=3038924 RepID=UPI00241FE0DB|nr:universal stress protein [Methylobacterium sp. 391_Methyba4]WFS05455.1 universal stress protein [Methylobacterium sp. 391_Methyba4]
MPGISADDGRSEPVDYLTEVIMTLSNIVVSLDASASTPGRVRLACNLARSFDATLTGVAAQDPLPISIYGKGSYLDSNIIEIAAASARDEISKQQAVFHEMTSGYNKAQLRVYDREPLGCVIEECARGDLLVARGLDDGDSGEIVEALSPAEIILRAGRPVLVTPSEADDLSLGCAIIAWKDTREARRAVADALPLLRRAERVLLLTIASAEANTNAEATEAYLKGHDVQCERVELPETANVAQAVAGLARDEAAGLVVAGAYGHSKMRELVFGSVTHELLTSLRTPCLYSH